MKTIIEKVRDYGYCYQVRWVTIFDDDRKLDGRYGWLKSEREDPPDEKEINEIIENWVAKQIPPSKEEILTAEREQLMAQKADIEARLAAIADEIKIK